MHVVDLHRIDLNLLVAFDALMAEQSVTRAGARIGRTQPAMSAALARLRALMGDELFVRSPGGLQPTPRAVELAEPLSHALQQIQRTLDFTQVFEPSSSRAAFTIGLSEHAAYMLLPALMAWLRTEAPHVGLRVRSFTARDAATPLLDAGEIDMAVGVPPTPAARILTCPLFEEHFVCVVRKDHPALHALFDLESFLALSHLLVSPENDSYGHVDAELATRGLTRRLGLSLPHMYVVPMLVARSDLVATLMAGVVQGSGRADELRVLAPPLDLPVIPFVLFWHRRNDTHPAQRWFRQSVAMLARPLSTTLG